MIVLLYIGIALGLLVAAFIIELLVVALYPGVTVQKQTLEKKTSINTENNIPVTRKDVSFSVNGTSIKAWLYLPENQPSHVPCVVMAHGLGGVKKMGIDSYAVRFQKAGMAVLAFDYRYLGESDGEPRQLIWIPYQLQDYKAAVAYARSLDEIDPDRIALWGTSLSGGHAIVTAADDNRIACVSIQCPALDGQAGYDQQMHITGIKFMLRMIGHAQRDLVRSWLRLSPHKIPVVGKPGTVAMMPTADAWEIFENMAPDDYENEACARILIRLDKYRPIIHANKIKCPVQLQICDLDFALPLSVVDKISGILGKLAEVIHYPIGHFDIYTGEHFEKAVSAQVAFFSRILLNSGQNKS